jgi:hypothetical protein
MEQHCLRGRNNDCRYAIKAVQPIARKNAEAYICAVADLALEAHFLSYINHPNIIKIRAMAQAGPFSATEPFFVILDRLYDFLGNRLIKWKKAKTSGLGTLFDCSRMREQELWNQRISMLFDLANALKHLHELKCVKMVPHTAFSIALNSECSLYQHT